MNTAKEIMPEKVGAKLYRLYESQGRSFIGEEAQHLHCELQAEQSTNAEGLRLLNDRIDVVNTNLEQEKENNKVSEARVKSDYRRALFNLFIAVPMLIISSILIYLSLAPSFYGREMLAALIAFGGGLVIFVGAEMLLEYLKKYLTARQLNVFIILTTLLMFCFALGGAVQFAKARALSWELEQYAHSDSVLDAENHKLPENYDIEAAKQKIEQLNNRGMILLFLGLEWLAGLFFFRSTQSIRKHSPMISLMKRRDDLQNRTSQLATRNAHLNALTQESIGWQIMAGFKQAEGKGSPFLLTMVLAILLGSIIFFFLLSEDAFGKPPECTYYLVAYDVTGSTDHDRLENQRAIMQLIDALKPCDEIQIMLITQDTFSSPEYLLSHKMPNRTGYFNEEIKRKKIQIMREFKKRAEQVGNNRCATSLIDGIYMFAQMCREQRLSKKILVMFSDMRQFTREISEDMIVQRGDKILGQLKADDMIPDMRGIDIHVMGASTAGLSLQRWRKLERFWRKFFAASGGKLKSYSIGRDKVE